VLFRSKEAVGELGDISLINFALYLGLSPKNLTEDWSDVLRLEFDEQLSYVLQRAKRAGLLRQDIDISQARHLFNLFKNNIRAMLNYRPRPIQCRVALFKASEYLVKLQHPDPAMGWSGLVLDNLEIQTIPGNHYTMLQGLNLQVLAERLNHCLDESQATCKRTA